MDIDQLGAVRFWPLKMYLINDWHILKIRILFSTMMNDKLSLVSFFCFHSSQEVVQTQNCIQTLNGLFDSAVCVGCLGCYIFLQRINLGLFVFFQQ